MKYKKIFPKNADCDSSEYYSPAEIEFDDHHDFINTDVTLAMFIAPVLKEFKKYTNSMPFIDKDDIPETDIDLEFDEYDYCFEAWLLVLDEMIFAFDYISKGREFDVSENYEDYNMQQERCQKGLNLFAKYIGSMWL